eukprot:897065-Pelagomonas_calceolata.AAC.1
MKRVPKTNSRYPLRSRGGRRGNREHSAPATPPSCKVRHPSQLLPEKKRKVYASQEAACIKERFLLEQRHIHFVEVKYCEETRPKNQLEASKQQHHDLCRDLSRASAQVTLHTILSGGEGSPTPPTLWSLLKSLALTLTQPPGLL